RCGEPWRVRAVEEEFLEEPDVEGVRGHAQVHPRLGLWTVAHGARVAHRAVQESAVDPLIAPPRHAYGEILALFVGEAERDVARSGQMERAHARQGLEYPVGKARLALSTGGPVLEMLLDLRIHHRLVFHEDVADVHEQSE